MATLRRRTTKHRTRTIITYDLETTRIEAGTPTPLYLSMFDGVTVQGFPLNGFDDLREVIKAHFLTEEGRKARYVGYNANRFDAPLIALAMMADSNYIVEPWLTQSGNFRGMAIKLRDEPKQCWHFSDAMSMFGFLGKLADFLKTFAPDQTKQTIDVLHFDSTNPEHTDYAKNDSIALWYAVTKAGEMVTNVTGIPPQNTIGKTAILYFESQIPKGTEIRDVPFSAIKPLRYAKRGGYVHCAGRYRGQVWKYDINQAYASVMRYPLPCGRCISTRRRKEGKLGLYLCTIFRYGKTNVPFYIRDNTGKPVSTNGSPVTGWILTPEIDYLTEYGWEVIVERGYYWSDSFTMSDMVDVLEYNRINCEGGPKGPLGTIYKMIGNNAYGKTLEKRDGVRLIYAIDPPEGYKAYRAEDPAYDNVWFRWEEPRLETYHKPQIGIFITAYVRLQIMRTAHLSPESFLYADTDCVAFVKNVTDQIEIDTGKYGAYKLEVDGEEYGFINKKVYYSTAISGLNGRPKNASSKGVHPAELTFVDWDNWYQGIIPKQCQTQRQALTKVVAGSDMFVDRDRSGSFVLDYFLGDG